MTVEDLIKLLSACEPTAKVVVTTPYDDDEVLDRLDITGIHIWPTNVCIEATE